MPDVRNKIVSLATARPEGADEDFQPTPAHEAIAGALNSQTECSSMKELADQAGVSVRTLQRAISDPAALQWMVAQQSSLAAARLGAVHARLFAMAMTSKSATWAKLYLERFDDEFKKQQVLQHGQNTQVNFQDMSHDELLKTISRAFRRLQGAVGPTGEVVPGVQGPAIEPGGLPSGSVGTGGDSVVGGADQALPSGGDC